MSGEAFDREYVKMMVKDHKKDVADFQKESMRGADADVKSFATRTLPTLQEHLQMIQRIDAKMKLRKSVEDYLMNKVEPTLNLSSVATRCLAAASQSASVMPSPACESFVVRPV